MLSWEFGFFPLAIPHVLATKKKSAFLEGIDIHAAAMISMGPRKKQIFNIALSCVITWNRTNQSQKMEN